MARLTLTFDNGPVPGVTGDIVDLLGQRGYKATFFLVGDRLADPAAQWEAERAHDAGHWIGNHTMTHATPLGERADRGHAVAEIERAQQRLGQLVHPQRFFRPIGGGGRLGRHLLSRAAADHLCHNRYTMVIWNNVPKDWEEPRTQWIGRALAVMASVDWTVLVLHDQYLGKMLYTLAEFLDRVEEQGIDVVQDFPDCCVPIRRGRPGTNLSEYMT